MKKIKEELKEMFDEMFEKRQEYATEEEFASTVEFCIEENGLAEYLLKCAQTEFPDGMDVDVMKNVLYSAFGIIRNCVWYNGLDLLGAAKELH